MTVTGFAQQPGSRTNFLWSKLQFVSNEKVTVLRLLTTDDAVAISSAMQGAVSDCHKIVVVDEPSAGTWDPIERYFCSTMLGHLLFARIVAYMSTDDVIVNLVEPSRKPTNSESGTYCTHLNDLTSRFSTHLCRYVPAYGSIFKESRQPHRSLHPPR